MLATPLGRQTGINGSGKASMVSSAEGSVCGMRLASYPRIQQDLCAVETDGASKSYLVSGCYPRMPALPAKLFLIKKKDGKDFVRAQYDIQSSGVCRLGWTDCRRQGNGVKLEHEIGGNPLPATIRLEARRTLLRSDSDITSASDCLEFAANRKVNVVFLHDALEQPARVNLVRVGDAGPCWISGAAEVDTAKAIAEHPWGAEGLRRTTYHYGDLRVEYGAPRPSSSGEDRAMLIAFGRERGWYVACRYCTGYRGPKRGAVGAGGSKRSAYFRFASEWHQCSCGSEDFARTRGQEVLLQYPRVR